MDRNEDENEGVTRSGSKDVSFCTFRNFKLNSKDLFATRIAFSKKNQTLDGVLKRHNG